MKSIILLNDTGLVNHLGCKAVTETLYDQFKKRNWKVVGNHKVGDVVEISNLPEADLVIINGEGSLHRNRHEHLIKVAEIRPSVLINSSYQFNSYSSDSLNKFKLITVRESRSFLELEKIGVVSKLVPDLSFASPSLIEATKNFERNNKNVILFDSIISLNIGFSLSGNLNDFITLMSNFGRVCTGRFHGAILASMLKIPFTAYPSNTHKIIGMMEDMGLEDLYFRTREEALFNMPLKFSDKQWTNLNKYTSDASVKIEESFNWIDDLF